MKKVVRVSAVYLDHTEVLSDVRTLRHAESRINLSIAKIKKKVKAVSVCPPFSFCPNYMLVLILILYSLAPPINTAPVHTGREIDISQPIYTGGSVVSLGLSLEKLAEIAILASIQPEDKVEQNDLKHHYLNQDAAFRDVEDCGEILEFLKVYELYGHTINERKNDNVDNFQKDPKPASRIPTVAGMLNLILMSRRYKASLFQSGCCISRC
jgi:hypothetical protein